VHNFIYGLQWGLGFFLSVLILIGIGLLFVGAKKFVEWNRENNEDEEENFKNY